MENFAFKGYETDHSFMSLHFSKNGEFLTVDQLFGSYVYQSNTGCNCVKRITQNPFNPVKSLCTYRADQAAWSTSINAEGEIAWFIPVNYHDEDDDKESVEYSRDAFFISSEETTEGDVVPRIYVVPMRYIKDNPKEFINVKSWEELEKLNLIIFDAWCSTSFTDADGKEMGGTIVLPYDFYNGSSTRMPLRDLKVLARIFDNYNLEMDLSLIDDRNYTEIQNEMVSNDNIRELPCGYLYDLETGLLIRPVKIAGLDRTRYFSHGELTYYPMTETGAIVFINNDDDGIEYHAWIKKDTDRINYGKVNGRLDSDELFNEAFDFNNRLNNMMKTSKNWEDLAVYLD